MQTIINIIVFVLILGSIIFIHELGHFLCAKIFGVYAPEFSLGMGPKIFSKKIGETEYQLRALPIGGFVAMAGEVDQEENELMKDVPFERTLKGISTWKYCATMLAGIFMNFVLAIVVLIGIYATTPMQTNDPVIGGLVEDGGAFIAGLEVNDTLNRITINNKSYEITTFSDLSDILNNNNLKIDGTNVEATLDITRDETTLSKDVVLQLDEQRNTFIMGITPTSKKANFIEAIGLAGNQFGQLSVMIFDTLGKLVTDSGKTLNQLSGPAGIYTVTAQVTETGSIASLLSLLAMLSVNIGIFNLMPIPGFDGYHTIIALFEKAIGRALPTKLKYGVQLCGFVLIFGLMIYVTFNDVLRIFG